MHSLSRGKEGRNENDEREGKETTSVHPSLPFDIDYRREDSLHLTLSSFSIVVTHSLLSSSPFLFFPFDAMRRRRGNVKWDGGHFIHTLLFWSLFITLFNTLEGNLRGSE